MPRCRLRGWLLAAAYGRHSRHHPAVDVHTPGWRIYLGCRGRWMPLSASSTGVFELSKAV
jgi:hypothetical protein